MALLDTLPLDRISTNGIEIPGKADILKQDMYLSTNTVNAQNIQSMTTYLEKEYGGFIVTVVTEMKRA